MKPKGINLFEQHVEKIVIGVAAVIVLGLAAKAFLTEPNAVNLDGTKLAPSEVDEVLANKARQLDAKVNSPTSLEVESVGRLTDWLEQQHDSPSLPEAPPVALVAPVTYKIGSENAGFASTATEMYAEVAAPQPKNLQVTSLDYTIDPAEVTELPELASRFEGEPPYDIHAVHVSAEFDGKALRSALSSLVENRKPIPSQWVDQDMAIVDVVVERQQMLPDGSWSSPESVSTIPGQLSVRDRLEKAAPRDKDEILRNVATYGSGVYQPGFFTLADGTEWSYDIVKAAAPKSPEVLDAERRLQLAWREVGRTQAALDRFLKQQAERKQPIGGESGGGGTGKGGKSGGFEGGGNEVPDESKDAGRPKETLEERTERRLNEAIAAARTAYDEAKKALLAIDPEYSEFPDATAAPQDGRNYSQPGGGAKGREYLPPEGMPDEAGGTGFEGGGSGFEGGGSGFEGGGGSKFNAPPPTAKGMGQSAAAKSLFENPSIRVWSHDITAEPGSTYRYRLAVGLYNPFFGRESRLAESQQNLASSARVLSPWTDWSEPVRVNPPQQFFAVTGIYNESVEDRSASFEVYSFTRGQHRVMTVTVRPGEPIGEKRTFPPAETGGESQEVDFFTGATLLDVVQLDGGSALNQRVQILVAMPDGSIQIIDPSDPRIEAERQRLRALAGRA